MRLVYVLAVLLVGGGIALMSNANDLRTENKRLVARAMGVRRDIEALDVAFAELQRGAPSPLRYSADALSELVSRTIEAGEVLGGGVRVGPGRDTAAQTIAFLPFKPGIQVAHVSIEAGLDVDGAAAILTMFEEELHELSVTVRSIRAQVSGETVSLVMEVDVFGRERE